MRTLLLITLMSTALFSCQKSLEEINENPNAPEQVDPQFLLSNVLWEAANSNSQQGWLYGDLLVQRTSNLEFRPADRYDLGSNSELWDLTYQLLNDLQSMEELAEDNDAYKAASLIMKSYLFAKLTDLWGPIPFSEALKGKGESNFTPAYDLQEAIYTSENGIIPMLKEAAELMKSTTDRLDGDIMYGGDLSKWERLANSLRLRYTLRISEKYAAAATELQALASTPHITDNSENAVVPYLSSAPNQWFIFNERVGRYSDLRMSTTIDSVLKGWSDPRLSKFFKPTDNSADSATPVYSGLPNGLSRDKISANYNLSDVSQLGAIFRDVPDGVDAIFMRADEVQFCLAEATQRGLIGGTASTYYEAGVRLNFDYYALDLPLTYLQDPTVALDGSDDLNRIMTQKWVSSFLNGYEGWFDVRRTGLPNLTIAEDNLNSDVYPVRFRYPESEQAVNSNNYTAAVAQIGADNLNQKGWWDK